VTVAIDTIPTDKTNATVLQDDHPEHHNQLASGVNETRLGGDGDGQQLFAVTVGQYVDQRAGAASSPDVTQQPPFKVTRTSAHPAGTFGGSAAPEQLAAISAIHVSQDPGAYQPIALLGIAIQRSGVVSATNDALGIQGYGWIDIDGSTNCAEAGYFATKQTHTGTFQESVEIQIQNFVADEAASQAGYSRTVALGISAGGVSTMYKSAVGILFARHTTANLDHGICIPAFSAFGDGKGPIGNRVYGDYASSPTSIYVGGSHAVSAITVDDQAGPVLVGTAAATGSQVGVLAAIRDSVGSSSHAMLWLGSQTQSAGVSKTHYVRTGNYSGESWYYVAGGASDFMVGTQPGDTGIRIQTTGATFGIGGFNGGGTNRIQTIRVGYANTLGFYGVTPVAQQGATTDLKQALVNYGLLVGGGATPVDLGGGLLTTGTGDAQQVYVATTPQLVSVTKGTAASPDTTTQPLVKATRTMNIADTAVTGDGGEQCAAILGISVGTSACQVQPVGVYGGAKTSSTDAGTTAGGNDACAVYGAARVTGSGTGAAFGGFFNGRRDTNTGKARGVEISVDDSSGTAATWNSAGVSLTSGVWLHATNGDCAVGIELGNPWGPQFDVGIGFNGQVAGGKTGPCINYSIRDESQSATSVLIGGTHATAALAVAAGAGPVVIGAATRGTASDLLEVIGPDATADPLITFGRITGVTARSTSIQLRTSTQSGSKWWVSGGSNNFAQGSVSGDSGIQVPATGKKFMFSQSSAIAPVLAIEPGTGSGQIGFFQATTAAKQTVTGSRGGNAALASLLTALAAYGLVTDSSTA
jgi:hypothetical protein